MQQKNEEYKSLSERENSLHKELESLRNKKVCGHLKDKFSMWYLWNDCLSNFKIRHFHNIFIQCKTKVKT